MIASPITWYVARAGGVLAYVLLTTAVVAGISLAGKTRVPGLPRFAVEDVHRFLGLLAGTFVAVHVVGIALDTTVPFSLSQLLVPFTASFRPLWTGLGVVALELLVALAITNRLRTRLPYRAWRALHGGAFGVWGLATAHALMTGTDRDQPWLLAVYFLAVAAVAASLALRLGAGRDPAARVPVVAAAAILALVVVVGLARIPLAAAPGKHAVATASRPAVTSSFSGPLTAAISTQDGSTARLLSVAGSAGRRSAVAFRIDLVTDGQAVTDSSLQVRFHAGRGVALCSGDITSIDDSGFAGTCALPDGATRAVSGTWSISGSSVTGRLVSQAA